MANFLKKGLIIKLSLEQGKNWWKNRKFSRNTQEKIDTNQLFILLSFYKNFHLMKLENPLLKLEDICPKIKDEMFNYELSLTLGYYEQRAENYLVLQYQIEKLMTHVFDINGLIPYPTPLIKSQSQIFNDDQSFLSLNDMDTESYLNQNIPVSDIEIFHSGVQIQHPDGFSFQIRKSLIDHPESGYGIFVHDGEILPGTIIGFYPGIIYYPYNLTEKIAKNNAYMLSRYDDLIIDARNWDRRLTLALQKMKQYQYISGQQDAIEKIHKYKNPFGIAHYINHPAPDQQPNILCYSYDFPSDFPTHLRSYIPNEISSLPKWYFNRLNCLMPTMLAISKKRIVKGEELLFNYRYNPSNPYPDWYSQPDLDEAKRRWGKVKLLL